MRHVMWLWDWLTAKQSGPQGVEGAEVSSVLSWPDARTASAVFLLVRDFRSWIHRRVEYIDFIDDVSVTRRVSIDFAVPRLLEDVIEVTDELLPCVPLTFLLKGDVLRNFDLRDAAGSPVPMLTKEENGTLAGNSLIYLAEDVLGEPLTGALAPLAARLRHVAIGAREDAQNEVDSWDGEAKDGTGQFAAELEALINRPAFIEYARILSENYILFAVGPPEPGKRRLMKFSWEEAFKLGEDPDASKDEQLTTWERLGVQLGWRRKTVNLAMPAVNLAASFHVEIPAPPDMEFDSARLAFKRNEPVVGPAPEPGNEGAEPAAEGDEDPPEDAYDDPLVQRVHLYKAGVDGRFVADALLYLRARRPGFLRAAVLTGWLTFALLAGGFFYLDDITGPDNSQTAAALLLLGPTLLAGSLIRPGEHRMVASVLVGVRVLLATGMAATVFAVGLLAGAAACIRGELWLGATLVAGIVALGLTVSYTLPRPTEE